MQQAEFKNAANSQMCDPREHRWDKFTKRRWAHRIKQKTGGPTTTLPNFWRAMVVVACSICIALLIKKGMERLKELYKVKLSGPVQAVHMKIWTKTFTEFLQQKGRWIPRVTARQTGAARAISVPCFQSLCRECRNFYTYIIYKQQLCKVCYCTKENT